MKKINLNEVEVVGSYGTFGDPVVIDPVTGSESVAELYFVDEDGSPICHVCQSRGCDYCTSNTESCRDGVYQGYETAWFI